MAKVKEVKILWLTLLYLSVLVNHTDNMLSRTKTTLSTTLKKSKITNLIFSLSSEYAKIFNGRIQKKNEEKNDKLYKCL